MILLCGIPTEAPLAMVARELDRLGRPTVVFNQRRFAEAALDWELVSGRVAGWLRVDGRDYPLDEIDAVYTRLMDDTRLPELERHAADSPLRRRCRSLHDGLYRWFEVSPARVVNRSTPQGSNSSKPFQAQIIASHGFAIPETLITNDPELVRDFARRHDQVVYKSMSGVRSIVQLLTRDDLDRLDRIRWCPVQFQEYVAGTNVRVHAIGDRVLATAISGGVVDYRYSAHADEDVVLRAYDLSDQLAQACVALAAGLQLPFAGIDLKVAPDGRVYCFEVNPCPAFSYYESHTGQPIARTLAAYLAGL
ncbi:MAG TPA: hypothetical protein VFA66_03500 [Gaiellaceae bacterium]|nr:hypothetical protein [Gaiellaceae bacterium]